MSHRGNRTTQNSSFILLKNDYIMRIQDYGRNDDQDNFNQKLGEIQKKLDDLQVLAMVDGDIASLSVPEINKLIEELKGGNTLQAIRQGISELNKKMEEQNKKFDKIISFISKMYQDGEINKDTFNKLDDFLKPYHDNSNLMEDY